MDLSKIDLNLLRVFREVLRSGSIADAAARLNVTPSAVSHALRRLRDAIGDPLFVRSGNAITPTPKAIALGRIVGTTLDRLADGLQGLLEDPNGEGPWDLPRVLRVAAPGALELTLVPVLAEILRAEAPAWCLEISSFERRSYEADLISGAVDFVLSVGGHTPPGPSLAFDEIWQDRVVCVLGPGHPFARRRTIGMEEYLSCDFIYPLPWRARDNYLDVWLARQDQHRNRVVTVPSYSGVGAMLSATDLAASMPDRTAVALKAMYPDLSICLLLPELKSSLRLETLSETKRDAQVDWILSRFKEAARSVTAFRPLA